MNKTIFIAATASLLIHGLISGTARAENENKANIELSKNGFLFSSADNFYQLTLKGSAQVDYRAFIDSSIKNDLLDRRLRPVLEAKAGDFSIRFMPDFAGNETRMLDAHIDYKFNDAINFRAGKFKAPLGLERLQSSTDTNFIERGHPTNLAPNRDIGVQVYGDLINNKLEYQFAVMYGEEDLGNIDTDNDNNKDFYARIFTTPFIDSKNEYLQGLGFGIASSIGDRDGTTTDPVLPSYKTPAQQNFFKYSAGSFASGVHYRIYPQAYWYNNNYGAIAEYAISSEDVTNGVNSDRLNHHAWQVSGSYVLTGEKASFKGVKPFENFNFAEGTGAWEATARIGQTNIDNNTFPLFANGASSESEALSIGAGINWYVNENAKLMLNYDHTSFEGSANKPNENALFTRVQYKF